MKLPWILGLILITQPNHFLGDVHPDYVGVLSNQSSSVLEKLKNSQHDHFQKHLANTETKVGKKAEYKPNQAHNFDLPFTTIEQPEVTADLTIVYENEPIMTINRSDISLPLLHFPLVDTDKLQVVMDQLDKTIRKEAIDASIDNYGQIIQEKPGIELNRAAFENLFYTFYYQKGSGSFQVPVRTIYPRVDSELIENIKTKLIGQYVTYFNSRNKERSHNIVLASNAINNHVVFPGESFSFNQTVGQRTKEKGYLPAPIIVRGELAEGIGGGICQVSSTLFNAIDRSGLEILQRFSHSKRVPYVPPGRDATVSWDGPDFKFKNQYNQPILIRSKVLPGMMLVFVYSSDDINNQAKVVPGVRNVK